MRKRTISCLLDNIMWFLIYILPLICFVIVLCKTGQVTSLSTCMTDCGLVILTNNIVFTALDSIFGSSGVLPLFVSTDILLYFSYFICVWLCHIVVDVLLWIVRYAHKLMDNIGG